MLPIISNAATNLYLLMNLASPNADGLPRSVASRSKLNIIDGKERRIVVIARSCDSHRTSFACLIFKTGSPKSDCISSRPLDLTAEFL